MSKPRPIRVALIGCGQIALSGHLPALVHHPDFELVGLCDVRSEALDAAASLIAGVGRSVPRMEHDYRALLAAGAVDACVLTLHPEQSVDVAVDLLDRGVAVLDEKPLAVTLEDGARLVAAVEVNRAVYQVGFCFRYAQAVDLLADWSRRAGTPSLVQVAIYDERPSQHTQDAARRIQRALAESSALNHEGSHIFDWMSRLNPAPILRVRASAMKTHGQHMGPNLWLAQLDHADGSIFQLTIGWLMEWTPPSSARIQGPEGGAEMELFTGRGIAWLASERHPVMFSPYRQEWRAQLDAFAAAIRTGKAHGATVHDGWRTLRLAKACERSAHTRQAVDLAPDSKDSEPCASQ